jgi:aryl-alcohol dehydrogenase-like predicted oxidoreductase
MTYRNLGSTGVQVSPLTLGAMMFGGWGNPDLDECVRIIHHALDSGINVIDTLTSTRAASRRRSSAAH